MTQLSFAKSRYIGDILDGSKTTTIRRNWERWVREISNHNDLHVYYGSWRSPNRQYVGKCKLETVKVLRGSEFVEEDALADGFTDLTELFDALMELNAMSFDQARRQKWAVLELGEWLDGPFWPNSGEQSEVQVLHEG